MSQITLTKDTAQIFINRFNALIMRNGRIKIQSTYTGRKELAGYVKTLGRNIERKIRFVDRTTINEICQHDYMIEADNKADMQLVRVNWDKEDFGHFDYAYGFHIKYGTKIKMSSEKIEFKQQHFVSKCGMNTTISLA